MANHEFKSNDITKPCEVCGFAAGLPHLFGIDYDYKYGRTVETNVRKSLYRALENGLPGVRWVIPLAPGDELVIEKHDMIDAIYRIGKVRKKK